MIFWLVQLTKMTFLTLSQTWQKKWTPLVKKYGSVVKWNMESNKTSSQIKHAIINFGK
jgi:hypothetical protein